MMGKEVRVIEYSLQNVGRNCKNLSCQDHSAKILCASIPLETSPIILGPPAVNAHILVVSLEARGEHAASTMRQLSVTGYPRAYT